MEAQELKNRAFSEMLKVAKQRLSGRSAEEIAANTKIEFDMEKSEFLLSSLGQNIRISYPEYDITPELNEWHHLTILHYLDMADGTEISSRLIPFGELSHGLVRGGGFDRQSERTISQTLANQSPNHLQKACEKLGAKIISSNADLCAVFPFLPLYPVTLKVWFADEDIAGTGRMFLDGSADHYLSVEDAVTVGSLILERLSALLTAGKLP